MKVLKEDVLSGRGAAKYLNLSDGAFLKAVEREHLKPQATMSRYRPKEKKTYIEKNFAMPYLAAVKAILGKDRGDGMKVFTPDVIERLDALNKEWDHTKEVDWDEDARLTESALRKR